MAGREHMEPEGANTAQRADGASTLGVPRRGGPREYLPRWREGRVLTGAPQDLQAVWVWAVLLPPVNVPREEKALGTLTGGGMH